MESRKWEIVSVVINCAALLAVFSYTDLRISIALYDPQSAFARFFEVFGELPNPICGVLSGALLLFYWPGKTKGAAFGHKLFSGLVWVFGAGLFAFLLLGNLNALSALPAVLVSVAAAVCGAFAVSRIPEAYRANAVKVALVGALLFVSILIVFNAVKISWGRMRFEEMLPPYAGFSPWPFPQGFTLDNAFMSFPSGHAAQSSVILMLTLLPCVFPKMRGKKPLWAGIAYAWIVLVCLSRIIIGAHFASDVVVGFLVTYLFFQLWRYVFLKNIKCDG